MKLIVCILAAISMMGTVMGDASSIAIPNRARQLEGEEEICFIGFVMDWFCIERGTLLDNPSVRTLEEPNRHSYHCLLDVQRCVNSGYEMLLDPENPGDLYSRALRLNAFGNQEVITLGRQSGRRGFCTTCNGQLGDEEFGFRAAVRGFLVPDSGVPQILNVTSVRPAAEGCGDMGVFVPVNTTTDLGSGGGGPDPVSVHGGLMVTAWGFLLPLGVLSARFLRHRPDGMWFVAHRICQVIGYFLAIIGIIVAFNNFGNVFEDGMGPSYRHGIVGLTTMICGFLQIVGGILRPHAPEKGEEKGAGRFAWEIAHKGLGYSAIVLAYAAIYLGAEVAGIKRDTFKGAFYATLGFAGVATFVFLVDKLTYPNIDVPEATEQSKGEKVLEDESVEA